MPHIFLHARTFVALLVGMPEVDTTCLIRNVEVIRVSWGEDGGLDQTRVIMRLDGQKTPF